MAERPIFLPNDTAPFASQKIVSFKWHAGMAVSQAQRSIDELHIAAKNLGIEPLLEISSKSRETLGVQLSAFNLKFLAPDGKMVSVESAYQGSKVFKNGDRFPEIYNSSSREAKLDPRIKGRSDISAFIYYSEEWPTIPVTAFYDWLYLQALRKNPLLLEVLTNYEGFTDIAFNPQKSVACQARCAAMALGMKRAGVWETALASQKAFLDTLKGSKAAEIQPRLF